MTNLGWTDDRVQKLKDLNSEFLSASQIARALGGGVTRNAVIGKLSRLGLMLGSGTKAFPGRQTQPRIRHVPVAAPKAPKREAPPADEPPSLHVSIMDIAHGMCRWPHGDPSDLETFHFCGHPAELARPYCAHHERRAAGTPTTPQQVAKWNMMGKAA